MADILTLNVGSSSIKFALFATGAEDDADPDAESPTNMSERVRGQVEGIGASPRLEAAKPKEAATDQVLDKALVHNHTTALAVVLDYLEQHFGKVAIAAVGHRVVHGGAEFAAPVVLDEQKFAYLERLEPLAPLHQPHNISGVRAAQAAFPGALQVACFDTAFHRAHPWVNDTYALPRKFYDEGVRRYGFHGLSYEYVTQRLREVAPQFADGRVVVSHLGNGASMCAIRGGRSVGSTMGFTALDGLPMGTRCGQLDPGVVLYLMREKNLSVDEIEDLLYRRSGLKGLSGLSHDMRELEAAETPEAEQAIDYFVFRIRRELGAMAAVLSGLEAMVFTGGIGENAWRIRERACADFAWLGIELDAARNRNGEMTISSDRSRVHIFVLHTNEELMIARHTARLLSETRPASAAA